MKIDEDNFEAVVASFLIGLAIGGIFASAMWANKCAHYEQRIDSHNLMILQGRLDK